jgi:hypothetical protein
LRTQKSRPIGAADVRDLASQFEMVAGARNYLKLRLSPTGYNVLIKLVAASERGLFRVAA